MQTKTFKLYVAYIILVVVKQRGVVRQINWWVQGQKRDGYTGDRFVFYATPGQCTVESTSIDRNVIRTAKSG